jgi:PDZ domain-containing protein
MRRTVRAAGFVLLVGGTFALGWFPLPYYAVGPGPAREVIPLIHVEGPQTFPSSGNLVMTTVRFTRVTAVGALAAWLDPERAVVGEQVLYPPGFTPADEEHLARSEMDQSKIDAAVVVLTELTRYPRRHADGALIELVGQGCPADGHLFAGEVIVRIDGKHIDSRAEASRVLHRAPAGEPLTLVVESADGTRTVRVEKGRCPGTHRPLVGVSLVEPFPFDITIQSGDVGGPSAGLMWAIGLYDLLTPGDLTEGRTVAGTGAIDVEGRVGPIGGVRDKVVAARDAGADILLVPRGNLRELRGVERGDLRVIAVSTFDQAVAALRSSDPSA